MFSNDFWWAKFHFSISEWMMKASNWKCSENWVEISRKTPTDKKKTRGRIIESDEICFCCFVRFSFFFVSFRSQPQTKAVHELIWIFEFDYGCHCDNDRYPLEVWLESSIFNDVSIHLDFEKFPKIRMAIVRFPANDDDLSLFSSHFFPVLISHDKTHVLSLLITVIGPAQSTNICHANNKKIL